MGILKNGVKVRFQPPAIEGEIVGGQFLDGNPHWLIQWTDADETVHQIFLKEEQMEVLPETPPEAPAATA